VIDWCVAAYYQERAEFVAEVSGKWFVTLWFLRKK
jgi:hypothetical protein